MNEKELFEKTPATKLFLKLTIPGMISMVMSSIYWMIDGVLVGHMLGADAFAALNLVLPIVMISLAVADLIGVGSAVPIAIKLGQHKEAEASNIFTCACLMIVSSATVLGIALFFFAEDLVRLMGAEEHLVQMAAQYLKVYALTAPVTTIVFAVDNYLRLCGKVGYSMMTNILMCVASSVLEWVFLFAFGFGIWAAALANCIGIFLSVVVAFIPFFRGKTRLRFVRPKPNRRMLVSIVTNGSPAFLSNMAARIVSVAMNVVLLRLGGAMAVSAYGVLMYVDGIIEPLLYGMCDSLQPAVGYNWGRGRRDRVKALELRCFLGCALMAIAETAFLLLCGPFVVSLFVSPMDAALTQLSIHALSLFAFAYVTRWISFATQNYFSAIGAAGRATIISVSTAFVLPFVLMAALSPLGLNGVWLNLPVTSLLAAMLALGLIFWKKRTRAEARA
ncbi:MAG: MATE family efflux transporter [Clostridia bacterium]